MQKRLDELIMNYSNDVSNNIKLVVIHSMDNANGNLWISNGKITHATIEESNLPRTGLSALYKLLSWKEYQVYTLDNCKSREISIDKTYQELNIITKTNFKKITQDISSGFARKTSITSLDVSLTQINLKLHDLNQLDGFVGSAIIDNSGQVSHSNIKKDFLEFTAACEVAFKSFKHQESLQSGMSDKPLKIMILESADKINAIFRFQDKYVLYIVLTKPEANLGLVRSIINNLV